MKKILLIIPTQLEKLGGTEKYNKTLIEIIKENYQFVDIDVVILEKSDVHNFKKEKLNYFFSNLKYDNNSRFFLKKAIGESYIYAHTRKLVYYLEQTNHYDMIINSTWITFNKLEYKNKYFLIQHDSLDKYLFKFNVSVLSSLRNFFRFFLLKNKISKKLSNIIVYDTNNKNIVKKLTNANIYAIPLSAANNSIQILDKEILKNRKKIIYLGRINQTQKNLNKLIEMNEHLNLIDFYGESYSNLDDQIKKKLIDKNWYYGYIDEQNSKFNVIKKYKFMILYSNYEGFSYSLVESLMNGVPIIVKDSYLSASFLCNPHTGLLLNKDNDIKKDIKLIKDFYNMNFDKYIKMCENCVDFYNKNLSFKEFKERWIHIFDMYLK